MVSFGGTVQRHTTTSTGDSNHCTLHQHTRREFFPRITRTSRWFARASLSPPLSLLRNSASKFSFSLLFLSYLRPGRNALHTAQRDGDGFSSLSFASFVNGLTRTPVGMHDRYTHRNKKRNAATVESLSHGGAKKKLASERWYTYVVRIHIIYIFVNHPPFTLVTRRSLDPHNIRAFFRFFLRQQTDTPINH